MSVSVFTLTAISVDRYFIIYKPLKARTLCTSRKIKMSITIIWCLSLFIMSPLLMVFKYENKAIPIEPYDYKISFQICLEHWPYFEVKIAYNVLLIFLLFIFPVAFMIYAFVIISRTLWFSENKKLIENLIDPIRSSITPSTQIQRRVSSDEELNLHKINEENSKMIENDAQNLNENNKKEIKDGNSADSTPFRKRSCSLELKKSTPKSSIDKKTSCDEINTEKSKQFRKVTLSSLTEGENLLKKQQSEKSSIYDEPQEGELDRMSIFKSFKRKKHQSTTSDIDSSNTTALNSLVYQLNIYSGDRKDSRTSILKNLVRSTKKSNTNRFKQNEIAIYKLLKSRRRVVKLLVILVILFLISWLPYHLIAFTIDLILFSKEKWNLSPNQIEHVLNIFSRFVYPVVLCFALGNSVSNAICYMVLSHGFRTTIMNRLKRWRKK